MSILTYSEQVNSNLEKDLGILMMDGENKLLQFESAFHLVDKALDKIKSYLSRYEFESEEEEISFFKHRMTDFLKESVYYSELFNMESAKPLGTKKEIKRFYEKELNSIRDFLQSNKNLHNYLLMKKDHQDKVFFLRSAQAPVYKPNLFWQTLDTRFCTVYTLYFARIKGTIELFDYIHQQLKALDGLPNPTQIGKKSLLNWTGKKVDLVELIYALKVSGVFNHGRADVREIAKVFEALFGMNFQDIYRTYTEISLRKKSRTSFLDHLKDRLEEYLEGGESLN